MKGRTPSSDDYHSAMQVSSSQYLGFESAQSAEAQCNGEQQHRRSMGVRFRHLCLSLGMTPHNLDLWEMVHVQSEAAIICYFSGVLISTAMHVCLFLGAPASGPYSYAFKVPSAINTVASVVHFGVRWRWGGWQHNEIGSMYILCEGVLTIPCSFLLLCLGYLCPAEGVPFQSWYIYTAVVAVLLFSMNVWLAADPITQPTKPFERLLPVAIFPSCIRTLRSLDSATDLSFIQVLRTEVSAWTLTVLDLIGCAVVNMVSAMDGNGAQNKKVLYFHALNGVCEIGIISVTLVNLLSQRSNPADTLESDRQDLIIMIVSLATTLFTLSLTIMGAGSAMAGLKVFAARVSAAGYNLMPSASKSAQKVVPDATSSPDQVTCSVSTPELAKSTVKLGPSDLKWKSIGVQLTRGATVNNAEMCSLPSAF